MNNREKLLGALVLAVLVGLGARSVHSRLDDAHKYYVAQEKVKEEELLKAQKATRDGRDAKDRLDAYRDRSLPSDPTEANLNYDYWLRDQLESAGFEIDTPKVIPSRQGDKATLLTYTINGDAKLEELIEFLYHFYRAKHLHKISSLNVTPDEKGETLRIAMKVEAYSLSDADRTDALAEGELDRLALDSLDAYRESIVDRNIFAVYTPPKPRDDTIVGSQSPPPDPPFDHAKHARATAIVEWNETPQVWILVETTGDRHRLFEGESFKIDDLSVKILKIDSGNRTVVYEADGEQYMVKLGKQNLREGKPVDPEKSS